MAHSKTHLPNHPYTSRYGVFVHQYLHVQQLHPGTTTSTYHLGILPTPRYTYQYIPPRYTTHTQVHVPTHTVSVYALHLPTRHVRVPSCKYNYRIGTLQITINTLRLKWNLLCVCLFLFVLTSEVIKFKRPRTQNKGNPSQNFCLHLEGLLFV